MSEVSTPATKDQLTRERGRAKSLLGQAEGLPTLPDIPARALSLLDDPDVSLPEVGDVVAMDPVLTARVIRLANSPAFVSRGRIESIAAAIVRLGARELRGLLLTVSVIDALRARADGLDLREIWRHAVATAVLARRLARDLREPEPDRAYLAGLFLPLGEVLLATCFPERFEAALARYNAGDAKALETEFGVGPPACCAHLLEHWGMPDAVVEVVAFQHAPELAPTQGRLTRIVWTASCACRAFGLCASPPACPPRDWRAEICSDLLAEASGANASAYLATLETVTESLAEILAVLV